jgi:hypothetical protein
MTSFIRHTARHVPITHPSRVASPAPRRADDRGRRAAQALRRRPRPRRPRPRRPRRPGHRHPRPQRRRQDHVRQGRGHPAPPRLGHAAGRRYRCPRPPRAGASRHRPRRAERRGRAGAHRAARTWSWWPACSATARRGTCRRPGGARRDRPHRRCRPSGEGLLGRHAAPARPRRQPGRGPGGAAARRAHHRPRPAHPHSSSGSRSARSCAAAPTCCSPPSTSRRPTSWPTTS